jgi:hypothetical protein
MIRILTRLVIKRSFLPVKVAHQLSDPEIQIVSFRDD